MDIDPLPVHVFLPLRGSSNTDLTAVTTEQIQEIVQIKVKGHYEMMDASPFKTQHAMLGQTPWLFFVIHFVIQIMNFLFQKQRMYNKMVPATNLQLHNYSAFCFNRLSGHTVKSHT